jgi:hypothetical protein
VQVVCMRCSGSSKISKRLPFVSGVDRGAGGGERHQQRARTRRCLHVLPSMYDHRISLLVQLFVFFIFFIFFWFLVCSLFNNGFCLAGKKQERREKQGKRMKRKEKKRKEKKTKRGVHG